MSGITAQQTISAERASVTGRATTAVPRIRENALVNSYASLLRRVRSEGLLERRRGYYLSHLVGTLTLFSGVWVGFFTLGDSWFQLLTAAVLGLMLTHFAFWAHEAAHCQIFSTRRANEWAARTVAGLLVGMSYGYWVNKHSRHHDHPNTVSVDPDIAKGALVFHEEAVGERSRVAAFVLQRQGYLLFPLLLFLGYTLYFDSLKYLLSRTRVSHRWLELSGVLLRLGLYAAVVFVFLPPGLGAAFIGVQMAVFGLYLGSSFAPNHKGMPIIPAGQRVDFLSRQVLTSRNISGGRLLALLMGGLNYQVEHHLFPDMARPQLRRAQMIVQAHCLEHGVPYTETSLLRSYGIVIRYLNQVGLAAERFNCPVTDRYR
ncbi:acyl-CoA desaturase [Arthrobacter sp. 260]|uniref:fatty acid desaturase family protein n=1 Tax=Arthrobacter sp. 260 TaxID=2735314 RepID=UPI001490DF99|nr:acyl-CoA desaturase [Arthrobacter sp. 260]NOJ60248.1 acyl-CoA desaturase [Arthrobacter sp. 260]